jgi:hypothetical protein
VKGTKERRHLLSNGRRSNSHSNRATDKKYVLVRSVRGLIVTAKLTSSPILVILMMEALSSSETSVHTRATRRNFPEEAILHSHCRENLISYMIRNVLKIGVVWDVTPCGSCKNRHSKELSVTSSVVSSSLILATLLKEALNSFE